LKKWTKRIRSLRYRFIIKLFLTTKNYRKERQIFYKELPGIFPADKIKSVSPDSCQNQIKGETLFT